MTIFYVRRISDLDADKSAWMVQGVTGAAAANATTDIDWKFPEERWISGAMPLINGGTWGDKIEFQIIDKDNVLGYGANVVLNTFAKDFYINPDSSYQSVIDCPYVALIPANVYLRIKYTNVNALAAASVYINLFTHIPKA